MSKKTIIIVNSVAAVIGMLVLGYSTLSVDMFSIILSLLATLVIIAGYSHLAFKMGYEVFRPTDWLTPLRWRIFLAIMGIVLTFIPGLIYRILLLYGYDSDAVLNVVRVITSVNSVVTLWLIYSIFSYKGKK